MKKLLLLLLFLPFLFGSCSNLDDDEKLSGDTTLKNTTWELTVDRGESVQTLTVSFSESTYNIHSYIKYDNGQMGCEARHGGTYTYNYPDITFVEPGDTYSGKIISDNKMTVRGSTLAYIKK